MSDPPLLPAADWAEFLVTFDDGHTEPLTVELVAKHWTDIEWFPRERAKLRIWQHAGLHQGGEPPSPLASLRLRVDWGTLRTKASASRS